MSETLDPAYPVQMQLKAYNARDIDAFMMWWVRGLPLLCLSRHVAGGRGAGDPPTPRGALP
ncbi:hypothetical protein [Aureimonas sp. D3]|uniref:hypothetical protein n=1 Tax=Aureimonas sp. D3 TaxID=1638164 RepID=UPI000AB3F1C5|nr:hypothetical protein [Aureimonas sp. D3]